MRKVLAVQALDRQVDALEAERRTLGSDAEAAALERQARAVQAEVRATESALAETERKQRLEELERQSLEADRDRNTQRLYGGAVSAARDIEGLQKNIQGAEARISALETSILEAMERAEALRKHLTRDRARLGDLVQALQSRRQASRARVAQIDLLLPQVGVRRQAAAAQVAPEVLREYDRLRPRAGGVAVAELRERGCGVCGVEQSPRQVAVIRAGAQRVVCEQCGRLLVDQAAEGGPPGGGTAGPRADAPGTRKEAGA